MTQPPPPQVIQPGWYPDPTGAPQSRYWDGIGWTDQYGPALAVRTPIVSPALNRVAYDATGAPVSDRSRLAATILSFFLGVFGVHRFYVGKVGTGILQLLTLGGLGIWALIDFILIVVGSFRDIQGRLLINW
jgi:TM2 domain/Protein of unknown function (DUF2510)